MDPNETKVYTAILIAAGVLGIILIFFVITIIRHQRRTIRLHKEKIEAEIKTLEKERKRIASDLHDDLGPLLSAVKMHLHSLEVNAPDDVELITKSNSYIDTILVRVREISNDLVPHVLIRKGLVSAINEFINNLRSVQATQIDFLSEENIQLSQEKEIHLFRIVQEIVNNTLKHANAKNLLIEFRSDNNKLFMLFKDDGIGFNYPQASGNGAGLGLKNILSRVEVLKGELYIEAKTLQGTRYSIEIPL